MADFGNVVQLINRLQSACTLLGDNAASDNSLPGLWDLLPSIVVIGGQSSGKSSVLEAVVGRDFLPRGTGIVTKRPLVLQLVHTEDPSQPDYGEFLHTGSRKWMDFDAMSNEIEAETIRHLGKVRKPVSPEPIQLTVYSSKVPNLTLVDMPGLTKVPIDGQPKTIVQDLEDMARTYIKGDNAIILAVTPANADLATSDALHLARQVDPSGDRTIGVLTKLDIMDKGTDARDVLDGKAVRLKHGWVAVVNRGQADLNSKMAMGDSRKRELEFFTGNPAYAGVQNVGTTFLSTKLSQHLVLAIRKQLPVIQTAINNGIISLEKELDTLGGKVAATRGGMIHLVLSLCRQFEDAFAASVDGGKGGGERILTVFETRLTASIRALNFTKLLESENVKRVVEEADGYQPHLVAPEMGYRRLLQECLVLFKGPADQAVEEVHAILRGIVNMVLNSEECGALQRYIVLKREIMTTAAASLDVMRDDARKMVSNMVEMERSYLTAEVFREILASSHAVDELSEEIQGGLTLTLDGRSMVDVIQDGPEEDRHLRTIAAHTSAYITHVRRQLRHTIPKAIVHCLVMQSKKKLLDKLHSEVAGKEDGSLKRLLGEDEGTMKRREDCHKRLKMLQQASEELSAVSF